MENISDDNINNFNIIMENISGDGINIVPENYNFIRLFYGHGPKKYTNDPHMCIRNNKDDNKDVDCDLFTGDCKYESVFHNHDFPPKWVMMCHIRFNRDAIIEEVNKAYETSDKCNGSFGCPECGKILFIVENNKIIKWTKSDIIQKIVLFHGDYKFGICCPGCCK